MLTIDWDIKTGWKKPQIQPFGFMDIHPFTSSLHYGIQCFEGMKAFKTEEGKIRLFRPECNVHRLKRAFDRLSLPDFDGNEFIKLLKMHVLLEKDWIPPVKGCSLYIRPTGISMDDRLGVHGAQKCRLFNVFSVVGPYYPKGLKPTSLYTDSEKIRAAPHGSGNYKLGCNYGPTIKLGYMAKSKGYDQVLWLFKDQVCEVGTSNIFFFWINKDGEKELITSYLDEGMILPGVTRDSILQITRSWNEFKVTETKIMMNDIIEAAKEGRLLEVFGAGTAVVVSPVEKIHYKGQDYKVPIIEELGSGELAHRILHQIQDIQYGKADFKNFGHNIDEDQSN
eukprot:TRINITY_DN1749_c0_g1_i7.p1 TRINITY_DN1749_c0_g1~~TRINITY_DN1749_c0_g1_i7.p1  ORF type:complete len:337 (-),score=55.50 TRINITY_DN1749_c0_g1_i7:349-1359(-)